MAKRSGEMIQQMPAVRIKIVPGMRWRNSPPTVAIMQPPSAIGVLIERIGQLPWIDIMLMCRLPQAGYDRAVTSGACTYYHATTCKGVAPMIFCI